LDYLRKGIDFEVHWRRFFLILLLVVFSQAAYGQSGASIHSVDRIYLPTQASDPPIFISNNTGFELRGFPGNGTELFPYLVANLTIFPTNDFYGQYCIRIWHTNVFFIIRNCTLNVQGSVFGYAIRFYNVTNGKIENCAISSTKDSPSYASYGVDLSLSSNIRIIDSIFVRGSSGVSVWRSSSCSVSSSAFYGQEYDGIVVTSSNDTNLSNNILHGTGPLYSHNGISVHASSVNCTVSGNSLDNFWGECIDFSAARGCIIIGNRISNSSIGISLGFLNKSQIVQNIVTDNGHWGILVDNHSYNNSFYENVLADNMINAEDNGHNSTWNSNWYSDYSGLGVYIIPGLGNSIDISPRPQTIYVPNLFTGIAVFVLILMIPAGAFVVSLDRRIVPIEKEKSSGRRPSLYLMVLSTLIPFGISPSPIPNSLLPELKYELVSFFFSIGASRNPGADWEVSYYAGPGLLATDYWVLVAVPYLIACLLAILFLIGYFRGNLTLEHFKVGVVTTMVVSVILPIAMVLPFAKMLFVVPITPVLGLSITYWYDVNLRKLGQAGSASSLNKDAQLESTE
jgi:parallel beta-helix repeat protein